MNKIKLWHLFVLAFLVRYIFAYFSGIDNFYTPDWGRYDRQSDQILSGDFNLEEKLFITAPLFSYYIAGMKLIFGSHFVLMVEAMQIFLSALSVIYLSMTARLIFNNPKVTFLTGIVYALYPITLFFTHVFGQESIFQSLFVICIYYFTAFLEMDKRKDLLLFSVTFTLALLTKSHVLLVLPFLLFSILLKHGFNKTSYQDIGIMLGVLFVLTLPYGAYNKVVNDTYVISSSGHGGHFITGHNDDTYTFIVNPPALGTEEYDRLMGMKFKYHDELDPKLEGLSHKGKQQVYLMAGMQWIADNPAKSFKLTLVNLKNFLVPGVSYAHYPFKKWLATFALGLPVFLLAYIGIVVGVVTNYKKHLAIISITLGMLAFVVLFYNQNRFRVITIEPLYLMYACYALVLLPQWWAKLRGAN